jgi:acetyltransferase
MTPQQDAVTTIAPRIGLLRPKGRHLDAFFAPRTVALIGASESPGSVGLSLAQNVLAGPSSRRVYFVNPRRSSVLGQPTTQRVRDIPEPVDLAIVATPAATVPDLIHECQEANVRAAIVIAAGFGESGAEGAALEQQLVEALAGKTLMVLGPNCLGVMCPREQLNATFAATQVNPGRIALLSQSGALLTAIISWSLQESVGFSAVVSAGAMADVSWGDLIDYFADDPHTGTILIYMESIGNARSFLSAAREASLRKPVIVIKAGRSAAAAKAAASHTGALVGADDVLDAAFRRSGVLRVRTLSELFVMAEVLDKQPRPRGPRLAIVTNAGGPGVLATDTVVSRGGELAALTNEAIEALNRALPAHWSHANPVDVLGDASAERFVSAAEIVIADSQNDGVLAILTPQAMTEPIATAAGLVRMNRHGRPLLAALMGGEEMALARRSLQEAGIPAFEYPEDAAEAFCYLSTNARDIESLFETPLPVAPVRDARELALRTADSLAGMRRAGITLLDEAQSKCLLAEYGIPIVPTRQAATDTEAAAIALEIGFPVAIKLRSSTIAHKTDVGGVRLNLGSAEQVARAFLEIQESVCKADANAFDGVTVQPMVDLRHGYELFLGSTTDPQFGPVIAFGLGGVLIEVIADRSLGLPPLNTTLAKRMIERTRAFKALQGVRGRPAADLSAVAELLVRFSWLVADQRSIKEIDINPLFVSRDKLVALDARVILHAANVSESQIPQRAIRSYPLEYVSACRLRSGQSVVIRPMRAEDELLLREFHNGLSESTVYQRYLHVMGLNQRVAHERLSRLCFTDYDREIALVMEQSTPAGTRLLGIARLIKEHGLPEAELSMVIRDEFQRQGIGTELLSRIKNVAAKENLRRVVAHIMPTNRGMQELCRRQGARLEMASRDDFIVATFELDG